jgi:hypothetical protein
VHLGQAMDKGSVDSPIATSVDVHALSEGSVTERNIAELVTTVEYVAKMQRNIADLIGDLRYGQDNVFANDPELPDALERLLAKASALELTGAEHLLPANAQLQEDIHEMKEMLTAFRVAALRYRQPFLRSTGSRPTLRSFGEAAGTGGREQLPY